MEEMKCRLPNSIKRRRRGHRSLTRCASLARKRKYKELVELLDRVTDRVGENEDHPLASLMDVLGVLIEKYEDEQVPELTE